MNDFAAERLAETIPEVQPFDEHNRRLLAEVRPPDWRSPVPSGRYNLVVIGGGTAGLVTAAGAAALGAKVALVEARLLGGDCLNVGCVPSKALIRSARAVAEIGDAAELGVRVPDGVRVEFPALMERMRRLRAEISPHDSARRFRELGVDVFLGAARFRARDAVEVDGAELRFAKACIATGSRPAAPPIDGLAEVGYLTNETVFSLTELPPRLGVVGGGPIGCELAQAFARFGSRVTLVQRVGRILAREEAGASEVVEGAMRRDGVELVLGAEVVDARQTAEGKVLVARTSSGERREIVVDEVLVAAGRSPNVESLDLEKAAVETDRAGVQVDDRLRTTNPNVFAAGDVCSRYKFTHVADALARIVIRNALFFGRQRASRLTVPWCTYTSPELAHVGLYRAEAEEREIETESIRVELSETDRAVLDSERDGFLEVLVRKGTDRILGGTLVAPHAGDLISELTAAIEAKAGLRVLSRTIHPYPTQAEVFRKAGDAWYRRRLSPGLRKVLATVLSWRR